ncbi:hypothetical protein AQUCO_10200001v1 [Aquilegia coerulea]|uniref:BED-type domain-containing protein n=2 Tax=Aquilegia coerulea TaxID=218851 RepID=A0A2G5C3Q9_AQUCA|nr:hypothetical protein AQUCO_10200001v1 [Aquilegia coerulea]PIA25929.1 hypothetical protein AQUCO_10200001v1 [Aquilegia coerulea]
MDASNQTQTVVKSSRLKSLVWNDFERVKKGDVMVAICKHCKKKLSASATSGTSHLKNHLNRCRKRQTRELAEQLILVREKQRGGTINLENLKFDDFGPIDFKFDERTLLNLKFDQERSRYDLARMIILHEYPLSMVEHVGFRRFVSNLQPSFQLMSCDDVKSDCLQIYGKEKQKVYEMLDKVPGRLSLTADMWTSYQDHGYLCLTAHYFDETWVLQKKILNFVMVDPHSEQSLAEVINTCLMDWDIDRKLFSVTFDKFFSNDVVFRTRERLSQSRLLPNNGLLFHVRCATTILSLIVQDMLEALNEVTHKIRESVRFVRSSDTVQQSFNEIAQRLIGDSQRGLCLDCPTQWNATYAMLEAALGYKDVFSHLQQCDLGYTLAPSDIEWERASTVCSYLKLFVEVANAFTGVKDPTANIYFPELCDINLQLIERCKSEDSFIKSMALKMKSRFDTYWSICSLVLAIAAILDPRFKMKLVEYYYPQIYGPSDALERITEVSNGIKDLYHEYAISSTMSSFDHGLACDVRSSNGINGVLPITNNDTRDRLSGFDKFLHENSDNQQVKSELDKYLEEPVFPRNVDFDILNWWKVNAPKYPILSLMARDVLGIPMSTVEFDSVFNIGERLLDPYRSSLEPDILQALVCTHDWLQKEVEECGPIPSSSAMPLCITSS